MISTLLKIASDTMTTRLYVTFQPIELAKLISILILQ